MVADRGEARLVEDAEGEPDLDARRQSSEDFTLRTLMCAPLAQGEEVIGVIEVVNKNDGEAFDEDDLFFISTVSEQAATALKNARLLDAERRAHDLTALLQTSSEVAECFAAQVFRAEAGEASGFEGSEAAFLESWASLTAEDQRSLIGILVGLSGSNMMTERRVP